MFYLIDNMFWYLSTFILERVSTQLSHICKKRQYSSPLGVLTQWNSVPWPTFRPKTNHVWLEYSLDRGCTLDVLGIGHRVWWILHGFNRCNHRKVWNILRCSSSHFSGCRWVGAWTRY